MTPNAEWTLIVVAVISLVSAVLAGRSARRASQYNADATTTSAKISAETQAYDRARRMDIETIERQDKEIDEIRENSNRLREKVRTLLIDNERLREDNGQLREDNETLKRRIARLERYLGERNG